ncbi:hypothetical protein ACHFCA_00840 [Delftia tsuruhatensis]
MQGLALLGAHLGQQGLQQPAQRLGHAAGRPLRRRRAGAGLHLARQLGHQLLEGLQAQALQHLGRPAHGRGRRRRDGNGWRGG